MFELFKDFFEFLQINPFPVSKAESPPCQRHSIRPLLHVREQSVSVPVKAR